MESREQDTELEGTWKSKSWTNSRKMRQFLRGGPCAVHGGMFVNCMYREDMDDTTKN